MQTQDIITAIQSYCARIFTEGPECYIVEQENKCIVFSIQQEGSNEKILLGKIDIWALDASSRQGENVA